MCVDVFVRSSHITCLLDFHYIRLFPFDACTFVQLYNGHLVLLTDLPPSGCIFPQSRCACWCPPPLEGRKRGRRESPNFWLYTISRTFLSSSAVFSLPDILLSSSYSIHIFLVVVVPLFIEIRRASVGPPHMTRMAVMLTESD